VAMTCREDDLVPGDTNGNTDVFVKDMQTGAIELVSVSTSGVQGNRSSGVGGVAISDDGRFVAFSSNASNLHALDTDTNGTSDVYLRDRVAGTTDIVSINSAGVKAEQEYGAYVSDITGDGRYVVMSSYASNLVAGDTNGAFDVFVHDTLSGQTERVSVTNAGAQAIGSSFQISYCGSISADAQMILFNSYATNLVAGDTNATSDIFIRHQGVRETRRLSVNASGTEGNDRSGYYCIGSQSQALTPDGKIGVFVSNASNLDPGNTNSTGDIFVVETGY